MYELHLTEVLLMDILKSKLCVERKAVIATEYRAAHFLMFFLFNIFCFSLLF